MNRAVLAFVFLACSAGIQANAAADIGTPQEFGARVRAGSVNLETFDFRAAGFWNITNRYDWVGGLDLGKGDIDLSFYSMANCSRASRNLARNYFWLGVAIGSRSADVWSNTAIALREQAHALDRAIWDSLAATGVTPSSSRAERLRRRYVWIQTLDDPALDAHLVAGLPRAARRYWNGVKDARIVEAVCANTEWLSTQLDEIGWFDIPRFGKAADARAWTLLDRTDRDPEIARRALHSIEAMRAGSANPKKVAYLHDQVAVADGRPQLYGTQGSCWWRGDWNQPDIADRRNVDSRRAAAGLPPLAEFERESKAHCLEISKSR